MAKLYVSPASWLRGYKTFSCSTELSMKFFLLINVEMPTILFSILFYPITLEGRRGTTDEFATIPFHLDLFSAALVELAKSIPVHSLILSSHLFFSLPLFLFPFTVPCRIVFSKPEDLETWPNHLSFRFLTRVRSSSTIVGILTYMNRKNSIISLSEPKKCRISSDFYAYEHLKFLAQLS